MNYLRRILAKTSIKVALTRQYCISSIQKPHIDPAIQDSTASNDLVQLERQGSVFVISLNRPHKRNAINKEMAQALRQAIQTFEMDDTVTVGVLHGIGGTFSSGYDMKEFFDNSVKPASLFRTNSMGQMFTKPMVCGISGYCIANGLELALGCDLRVVEEDACLGFFNRRFGMPLMDGGAARLTALIGASRALDLIMTGRFCTAKEAFEYGLANRIVATGTALGQAVNLAQCLAKFPQATMQHDRNAVYAAMVSQLSSRREEVPVQVIAEMRKGIEVFSNGIGRAGKTNNIKEKTMADWELDEYNIEQKVVALVSRYEPIGIVMDSELGTQLYLPNHEQSRV